VFFFGGYGSTWGDVDAWGTSFEGKVSGSSVTRIPYPGDATAGDPLNVWNEDRSEHVAQAIKACRDAVVIIGHSSGCAIANDVAKHARTRGCSFKLVALDGFCPSEDLLALPDTSVWSAMFEDEIRSLNYDGLKAKAGNKFRVYKSNVSAMWPLHFSLINLNVVNAYHADHRWLPQLRCQFGSSGDRWSLTLATHNHLWMNLRAELRRAVQRKRS